LFRHRWVIQQQHALNEGVQNLFARIPGPERNQYGHGAAGLSRVQYFPEQCDQQERLARAGLTEYQQSAGGHAPKHREDVAPAARQAARSVAPGGIVNMAFS
jgi:hypothetical protein